MALVICTECGNRISDRAMRCPKCGAPIKPPVDKYYIKRSRKNRKYLVPVIYVVVIVTAILGVYFFLNSAGNNSQNNEAIAAQIEEAKAKAAQAKAEAEAAKAEAANQQRIILESSEPVSTLVDGGRYRYSGTIAGSNVQVTLINEGGTISGSYHYSKYAKHGDRLTLSGTLSRGEMELNEYNTEEDEYTGRINLRVQGSKLVGTHTNYDKGRTTKVYLSQN